MDGEALFRVVQDLAELGLREARGRGRVVVCGVGCGGPMTRRGTGAEAEVSPLNIPAWRRFPLSERLHGAFEEISGTELAEAVAPGVSVFVDNDAKAVALAEGWTGAAVGENDYIAMVVSTGVGGGIVLDGRLLEGANGNAGHIGHVIVEPEGHECACGARGCLEAEASGTAIRAFTGKPAEQAGPELVERTGRLVGRAVASVANLLDLKLAVVGGGVALGFGARFFLSAQREIARSARLEHSVGCRIEPAGLGPAAPLVGAAALGWLRLTGKRPG